MSTHTPSIDKHAERKMDLLRLVQSAMQGGGPIPINDLAERLGISGSTLRRDLHDLQQAGAVRVG